VATFVIETYLSRARSSALGEAAARLRKEVERMAIEQTADGAGTSARPAARYLRSFYVADDEVAYYFVETGSAEAAAELSRAAGLVPERIVEAEAASG
jgi:hypothetical protein